MSKKELMKLADSFQKKADTAFQNYQDKCLCELGFFFLGCVEHNPPCSARKIGHLRRCSDEPGD